MSRDVLDKTLTPPKKMLFVYLPAAFANICLYHISYAMLSRGIPMKYPTRGLIFLCVAYVY